LTASIIPLRLFKPKEEKRKKARAKKEEEDSSENPPSQWGKLIVGERGGRGIRHFNRLLRKSAEPEGETEDFSENRKGNRFDEEAELRRGRCRETGGRYRCKGGR